MQSPEESVRSDNSLWVHCRSEESVGHGVRGELGLTVHDGCGGPHYGGQLMSEGKLSEGTAQIRLQLKGEGGRGSEQLQNKPINWKQDLLFFLISAETWLLRRKRQTTFSWLKKKKKKAIKFTLGCFRQAKSRNEMTNFEMEKLGYFSIYLWFCFFFF